MDRTVVKSRDSELRFDGWDNRSVLSEDGTDINYYVCGDKEHPTVLLVHGLTSTARSWDPVVHHLAARYHVVAIDLRGHGFSGWARWKEDGYRTSRFVADLRCVLDEIGVQAVHIIGHSLGARIGLVFAATYPNKVLSLSLSDTLPEIPAAGLIWARDMVGNRASTRGYRSFEEYAHALREEAPGWGPGQYEHFALSTLRRNWVGKYIPMSDPDLFWVTTGSASKRDNNSYWDAANSLECPTLILWGQDSPLLDADIVERFQKAAPQTEIAQFACGHYIMREKPQEWVDTILKFIEAHSQSQTVEARADNGESVIQGDGEVSG